MTSFKIILLKILYRSEKKKMQPKSVQNEFQHLCKIIEMPKNMKSMIDPSHKCIGIIRVLCQIHSSKLRIILVKIKKKHEILKIR